DPRFLPGAPALRARPLAAAPEPCLARLTGAVVRSPPPRRPCVLLARAAPLGQAGSHLHVPPGLLALPREPVLQRGRDDDAPSGDRLARVRALALGLPPGARRARPVRARALPHAGGRRARRPLRSPHHHDAGAGGAP